MSLYTRLMHTQEPPIQIHQFGAAVAEYLRAKWTRQQVIDAFSLSAGEATELDTLVTKVATPKETMTFTGRQLLTNLGTTRVTLGVVQVDSGGVTGFEWGAAINRNGSVSTLTFELRDVTDLLNTVLLDSFTDTTGTGDKFVGQTKTFAQPLAAGTKRIAFVMFAGNATDDPLVYGAGALVRRVDRLTADDLHGLLMLAEDGAYAPLDTEAELKARLGV